MKVSVIRRLFSSLKPLDSEAEENFVAYQMSNFRRLQDLIICTVVTKQEHVNKPVVIHNLIKTETASTTCRACFLLSCEV